MSDCPHGVPLYQSCQDCELDGGPGMVESPTSGWVCIGCKCTDLNPCDGGCAWVAPNLCSRCMNEAFADPGKWTVRGVQPVAIGLSGNEAKMLAMAGGAVHRLGMRPTEYLVARARESAIIGGSTQVQFFINRADKPGEVEVPEQVFADGSWIEVTGPAALARIAIAHMCQRLSEESKQPDHNDEVNVSTLEKMGAEIRAAFDRFTLGIEQLHTLADRAQRKAYPHPLDENGSPLVSPPPTVIQFEPHESMVIDGTPDSLVCLGCELNNGRNVMFPEGDGDSADDRWHAFAQHMTEHFRVLAGES